jgi:hypothetical protein
MVDWAHVRRSKHSKESPSDWPSQVRGISQEGLSLLGIHEQSGKLYWDGREITTRHHIRLGDVERVIVAVAALATFGVFVIELGRTFLGWR